MAALTLTFDELSGGYTSFLFIHLLESNGLIVELELDLSHFMADCERQYGRSIVATADVLLGTYLFLRDTGFYAAHRWSASRFAAALHDLAHPGSTNGHEVKACSPRLRRAHPPFARPSTTSSHRSPPSVSRVPQDRLQDDPRNGPQRAL